MGTNEIITIIVSILALIVSVGSFVYQFVTAKWKASYQKQKALAKCNSLSKLEYSELYDRKIEKIYDKLYGFYPADFVGPNKKFVVVRNRLNRVEKATFNNLIRWAIKCLRDILENMQYFSAYDFKQWKKLFNSLKKKIKYGRKYIYKNRAKQITYNYDGKKLTAYYVIFLDESHLNILNRTKELKEGYDLHSPSIFNNEVISSLFMNIDRVIFFESFGILGGSRKDVDFDISEPFLGPCSAPLSKHDEERGDWILKLNKSKSLIEKLHLEENTKAIIEKEKIVHFDFSPCSQHGKDLLVWFDNKVDDNGLYPCINADHPIFMKGLNVPIPLYIYRNKETGEEKTLINGLFDYCPETGKFNKEKFLRDNKLPDDFLEQPTVKFQLKVFKKYHKKKTTFNK